MYPLICCQKQLQDGTWERPRKTKFSILTGPRETVTGGMRRPQGEISARQWALSSRWGGERERRGGWLWGPVPFLRFCEGTEQRVKGDLNGKSECPVVMVRGGEEGNWWQGQPSRWCTWPSWWDVYTLWGCSDSRKVWSFKIYSRDSQVWGFCF